LLFFQKSSKILEGLKFLIRELINKKMAKTLKGGALMKKSIAVLLTISMLFSLISGALRENVVKANSQPIWPMFRLPLIS